MRFLLALLLFVPLVSASILSPDEAAVSGYDSSTLNASFEELITNGWQGSGNVTRTIGDKLIVPWFSQDNKCTDSDLQTGSNCNIGGSSLSESYCMVSDELSQVCMVAAMSNNETMFDQCFNTLNSINSTRGQLPSWKILVNETSSSLLACDSRTNSNCDTASDATARFIVALYSAANNTLFTNTSQKQLYWDLATNLSADMVEYEYVNLCQASSIEVGSDVCYWLATGSVSAENNLTSDAFTYTGYFPDAQLSMLTACHQTGNQTYCGVARNTTLNYLEAAKTNGSTFKVPPGKNFKWSNLSGGGTPAPVCTDTCSPDQWDSADAARAFLWGTNVYYADQLGLNSTVPFMYDYVKLWDETYARSLNSLPIQYYSNGTASASNQSGYRAQGFQSQLLMYGDAANFNTTLRNALDHYNTATDTMDWAACMGVYGQTFPMRSLGIAIGREAILETVETANTAPTISSVTILTNHNSTRTITLPSEASCDASILNCESSYDQDESTLAYINETTSGADYRKITTEWAWPFTPDGAYLSVIMTDPADIFYYDYTTSVFSSFGSCTSPCTIPDAAFNQSPLILQYWLLNDVPEGNESVSNQNVTFYAEDYYSGNDVVLQCTLEDVDSDIMTLSYSYYLNGSLVSTTQAGGTCEQPTATTNTSCLYQLPTNTPGYSTPAQGLLVNYTKPTHAQQSTSRWEVLHGELTAYNITIPSTCWDAHTNTLELKIESSGAKSTFYTGSSQPQCYNGTAWEDIGTTETGTSQPNTHTQNDCEANMYDDSTSTGCFYYTTTGGWSTCLTGTSSEEGCFAAMVYEETMWWDIGFQNGTTVNVTTLEEETLVPGATLQVACTPDDGVTTGSNTPSSTITLTDYVDPTVSSPSAAPPAVIAGLTATLTASFTDAESGFSLVQANISYGGSVIETAIMSLTSGNTYRYEATNTNNIGTYTVLFTGIDEWNNTHSATTTFDTYVPSGGGGSSGSSTAVEACGFEILKPTSQRARYLCAPGSQMGELEFEILNTIGEPRDVEYEVPIEGCELDPYSDTIEGNDRKTFILKGCECPPEKIEFNLTISQAQCADVITVELEPSVLGRFFPSITTFIVFVVVLVGLLFALLILIRT